MKKALVIGFGMSGKSATHFLTKRGWNITIVDKDLSKISPSYEKYLDDKPLKDFSFDLIVISPGIPPDNVIYRQALMSGIEMIGEVELGLRELKCHVIGVTGSSGKSTTVSLIHHVLLKAGIKSRLLGNIGVAITSVIDEIETDEWVVLEMSSFQLETSSAKKMDFGLIVNVLPNHLDRHASLEEYFLAKRRLFSLLKPGGRVLIPQKVEKDFAPLLRTLRYEVIDNSLLYEIVDEIPSAIQHIKDNILMAERVTRELGISKEAFIRHIQDFQPLKHRLERVGETDHVMCINDSKATTIESVMYGVRAIGKNIVLIAGGKYKGGDFTLWNEAFLGRVKGLVCMGEAKELIYQSITINIPKVFAVSMEDAIEKGLQLCTRGDNLMLSPGCSSYDMFQNFEKRGDAFKEEIAKRINLSTLKR